MAFSDQELIEVGARFATQQMMEQIPVSTAAARKYQTELGAMFPLDDLRM